VPTTKMADNKYHYLFIHISCGGDAQRRRFSSVPMLATAQLLDAWRSDGCDGVLDVHGAQIHIERPWRLDFERRVADLYGSGEIYSDGSAGPAAGSNLGSAVG